MFTRVPPKDQSQIKTQSHSQTQWLSPVKQSSSSSSLCNGFKPKTKHKWKYIGSEGFSDSGSDTDSHTDNEVCGDSCISAKSDQNKSLTSSADVGNEASEAVPKNVSPRLWEKFQQLKDKRSAVSRKSTERRIERLQKDAIKTVKENLIHPEDLKVLEENDVRLPRSDTEKKKPAPTKSEVSTTKDALSELEPYMDINKHLVTHSCAKDRPKTELEQEVDRAIARGDVKTAEKLSDKLATRQLGDRVTAAVDAQRFHQKRKQEAEFRKKAKKKKLAWGFEAKERWESKGNM